MASVIIYKGTPQKDPTSTEATELAAEDFYYEGSYVVFTAAYHLRRGFCCNSDCRHCPYREAPQAE